MTPHQDHRSNLTHRSLVVIRNIHPYGHADERATDISARAACHNGIRPWEAIGEARGRVQKALFSARLR